MSDTCPQITKPAEFDHLIAHATTMGFGHHAELPRQARVGRINLIWLDRGGVPPMGTIKRSPRPVLVLLGDDDYQSTGPAGWTAANRLLRWATGAVIHGTGGDIASYKMAAGMAIAHRRFLLIETNSLHIETWGATLKAARVPFLALKPSGGLHPLPLDQGVVQ